MDTMPQVIETEEQYRQVAERLGNLVGKGRGRSADETELLPLLALLVEDYDRRNALPPDRSSPAETLRFLMEHSGKTAIDLPVLTAKRGISAPQAQELGRLFRVDPGLFL